MSSAQVQVSSDGQFVLRIDLEGDQFGDPELQQTAVAAKLHEIALKITQGRTAAVVRDVSGNKRGEWEFKV